jgi:hypothetical protein
MVSSVITRVSGVGAVACVLHREPHCLGPFDMQLVYEDMPQECGSYLCRAAHICANRDTNGYRYGYGYGSQVCIYTSLQASRRSDNKQAFLASKVTGASLH